MTKKVNAEILLQDILERLRVMERNDKDINDVLSKSNSALDVRLCAIEKEIESVKRAAKAFSLLIKIVTGLVAFIIMIWNFFGKFFVRKI